jgi:hypothetical protein
VTAGFRHRRLCAALAAALAAAVVPGAAGASAIFGDVDVSAVSLKVDRDGTALVEYRTAGGRQRHVLVRGAVDAVANPTLAPEQRRFRMDYTGGWKSRGDGRFWRRLANACRRYDGPPLPFLVAACKAPDGSYWALQSWQRNLPMRGFDPWTPAQRAFELHVSHWTGDLPQPDVVRRWTYGGAQQGFFGRLLYRGQPVFGTRTASAQVSDPFARNVSIDVLDSGYGPGWRHETAIAAHRGDGGFCFTFVAQPPPAGYPAAAPRGSVLGERFRVSAMGPGVTPIVQWEGARLTGRDPAAQAEATRLLDAWLGGDAHCAAER